MITLAKRFWHALPNPKPITVSYSLGYLVCLGIGVLAEVDPPNTFNYAWSDWVTRGWAALLILGGAAGAWAAPQGKWLIEKPAIVFAASGLAMYASVVLMLHLQQPGNRLIQFLLIILALDFLLVRYLRIHKYSYEPGK